MDSKVASYKEDIDWYKVAVRKCLDNKVFNSDITLVLDFARPNPLHHLNLWIAQHSALLNTDDDDFN